MTIRDLIRALSAFPDDTMVCIDDADTGETLEVLTVTTKILACGGGVVLIGGDYSHEITHLPYAAAP